MKKRILSLLLVLALVLSVLPVSAMAASPVPTEQQAHDAMLALKTKYPEGLRWTNDNYYGWNGGIYSGGLGCAGFAFLLSDAAFGDLPARIERPVTLAAVHVGDILRINNDTHSVIITEVQSDRVVIAEGNYNSSVHWGRTLSAAEVAAADFMITRYPLGTFGDVYTVTFDNNGGTSGPGSLATSGNVTIPTRVPVRHGYALLGWALTRNATTPKYVAGDQFTVTKDTTLYAVWKAQVQTISSPGTYTAALNAPGSIAYYSFTPKTTGTYDFESTGNADTLIALYNKSWEELTCDDDSGSNYNFHLSVDLTAGTAYYLSVQLYDEGPDFDNYFIPQNIRFTVTGGSSVHTHSYTVTSVLPTCTEGGYTLYKCACGEGYTTDTKDPLGHSYLNGTCTRCGEKSPTQPENPQNPFVDVRESDYFYAPVLWAVKQDITNGMNADHFAPNAVCTRAQVVTFLWRAKGCPAPASTAHPFTDVKTGQWYTDAVLWAVENGITNGVSSTRFGLNEACTRAQTATFLWRAAGKPAPTSTAHPFTDVKAGQWYTDAVLWAVENGITNGMSPTTFKPNNTCTRGQIVTFLYRAVD